MINKLKYIYSKIILLIQIPSIRECKIDKTAKVGARSNLIKVKIGKYSYMGNNNSVTNTEIGKFCSIASYCAIGGGDHPIDWVSTSPLFYSGKSSLGINLSHKEFCGNSKVVIKNDVWIGENCFINSGVSIGNGAIIGAHSVVTKDIPDYAIAVGSPARVIKYRFNNDIIEKLNEIKWWDFTENEFKEYIENFDNPKKFIDVYKGVR